MSQALTAAWPGWLPVLAATQAGAAEVGCPIRDRYDATIAGTLPARWVGHTSGRTRARPWAIEEPALGRVVLPVFDSSLMCDGFGLAAGTAITAQIDPTGYYDGSTWRGHWWACIEWGINERTRADLRYYETGPLFGYLLARRPYLDFRELEIAQ